MVYLSFTCTLNTSQSFARSPHVENTLSQEYTICMRRQKAQWPHRHRQWHINMKIRCQCMPEVSTQSNMCTPFLSLSANQCDATPAQWLRDPEHWLCLPQTAVVFVILKPLIGTLPPLLMHAAAISKTTRRNKHRLESFFPSLGCKCGISPASVQPKCMPDRLRESKEEIRKHWAKEMMDEACKATHLWPAVHTSQLRRRAAAVSGARFWLHRCYWSDVL